ncbi:hypothetical protein HNY73_020227 [Argiope bruennichi]|uniref:Uncharacterized protein n=1 Tax=Argiope bruennichi TaxID=94029 RepID=A0A8T0E629_ARGBR|nr:hypothetical protein HNY73_020227 [Argiope bruennichi]
MDFDTLTERGIQILNDYNVLERNIELLKKTISMPLFAILLSCSLNMYFSLDISLKVGITPFLIAEYVIGALVGFFVILSLTIYSSKIPETIQEIKKTAGYLQEKYHLRFLRRGKDAFFLDRLEKKEVIFLSAGGIIDMRKNLSLTIMGTFFTYGLLIKNLKLLIRSSCICPKHYINSPNKYCKRFVGLLILIFHLLPIFLAALQPHLYDEKETTFWAFGYKFEERKYDVASWSIGEYIQYAVFLEFFCIVTLSGCLLIRHCGIQLTLFHLSLKSMDYNVLIQNALEVLNDYKKLEENIRLLKQVSSMPLFLILLNCCLNLYGGLAYFLKGGIVDFLAIQYAIFSLMGILAMTTLILYSSIIPEIIQEIKETSGHLIEKHQLNIPRRGKETFFLKRLEKKNVIFLSAGGMVDLKKSLILSIIGALFTYGLLIINLN